MIKPFNFLQFGGTGSDGEYNHVAPFTSGLYSGFVEFYTPIEWLTYLEQPQFLLVQDITFPTYYGARVSSSCSGDNIGKNTYSVSIKGGFAPFLKEDSQLISKFRGNTTGDMVDRPVLISRIEGGNTGDMLDKPTLVGELSCHFPEGFTDRNTLKSQVTSNLTGDMIGYESYSFNVYGAFYHPERDKAKVDINLIDILFDKGNVQITEFIRVDSAAMKIELDSIIFGI